MTGTHFFADRDQWQKVADALQRSSDRGDTAGFDTEFYGVDADGKYDPEFDIRKSSCAGQRTRVHMWSVAIKRWPHHLTPRGYHLADAAVLLSDAFDHPGIRDWIESSAPKAVHNLSVDDHATGNHGIRLGGAINTLALARWVWPERARGAGFSLDSLGNDVLGLGKTEGFEDIFSEEVEEVVRVKRTEHKRCECGVLACRKKLGHKKVTEVLEQPVTRVVRRSITLPSVVPGHSRFQRATAYSARDSIVGLALSDRIEREMGRTLPWAW